MSTDDTLVDIIEQLKFNNAVIQAQGFSHLVEQLNGKITNKKVFDNVKKVYFDCFCLFGRRVFELFIETVDVFLNNDIITRDDVFKEIIIRLDKIEYVQNVIELTIEKCQVSLSDFLKLVNRVDKNCVIRLFSNTEFAEKNRNYLLILLFSNVLDDNQKIIIGSHPSVNQLFKTYFFDLITPSEKKTIQPFPFMKDCPSNDLSKIPIDKLTSFEILQIIRWRPSIINNKNLEPDLLFLPDMISIMQSEQLLSKANISRSCDINQIRQLVTQCQIIPKRVSKTEEECISLDDLFNSIVNNQQIEFFIDFLNYYFEAQNLGENELLLPFIVALFPYSASKIHGKISDLIVRFCKIHQEQANIYVMYFITLFAKPFFPIQKSVIINTITNLALNRFIVSSVVKFLCAVSGQVTEEKCQIYNCLGELVDKYPTIYNTLLPLLKSISPNDADHFFKEKLKLIRKCCLATDDCEEVLAVLSQLLKENGPKLAFTLEIVHDLCMNDILEFQAIRKLLSKKIGNISDESVIIEYSKLLGLGVIPAEEENEEYNTEVRIGCIKELYAYTTDKNKKKNAAAEAWRSLGKYNISEIEEALKISISEIVNSFVSMSIEERKGFADFLSISIEKECENYPRSLYNTTSHQTIDILPLFTKVDTFKNTLNIKYNEDEIFWKSTLPLVSPILQITSAANKAVTSVRLIRSCATMVPTSKSHEDMISLIASWRICIREALNSLSESKNNDILWARDQICEEGRRCLADSSDSVDNIMMILTVLVEIIDEKVKTIDDNNQIDQIVNAQKPWLISVFEFCATRLPKDLKSQRTQKMNPIYQIMTQSTKSSLHIAIFCVRLLLKNPTIIDFYRAEKTIQLMEDPVYEYLINESSKSVEFESREYFWQCVEAYGVNNLTAQNLEKNQLEKTYKNINKNEIEQLLSDIENEQSLQKFFEILSSASHDIQLEFHSKSRKIIEKFWNNGDENMKRVIYNGLSRLILCSGPILKQKKEYLRVEKLPDTSVISNVLHLSDQKYNIDEVGMRLIVSSLIRHKRKDGRFLPCIDWNRIISKTNWKNGDKHSKLNLLNLACEQKIEDIVYDIVTQGIEKEEIVILSENFSSIIKILPTKMVFNITKKFVEVARTIEDQEIVSMIVNTISKHQFHPIVKQVLVEVLPDLKSLRDVMDPILNGLKEPQEFVGCISNLFDFWIESRNKETMKIKRICELFTEAKEEEKLRMMGILSLETAGLSIKKRIEKILDVITASRISRSSSADMTIFFPIIISLIVSPSKQVNIPLLWFENEKNIQINMYTLFDQFFEVILKSSEMKENAKYIASFLIPYISGPESDFYDSLQKEMAKKLILKLLAEYSSNIIELFENEKDELWIQLFS